MLSSDNSQSVNPLAPKILNEMSKFVKPGKNKELRYKMTCVVQHFANFNLNAAIE